ncbi:MAG: hypothetical protein WCF84_22410 [Anaerolineae bacterium]
MANNYVVPPAPAPVRRGMPIWLMVVLGLCGLLVLASVCVGGGLVLLGPAIGNALGTLTPAAVSTVPTIRAVKTVPSGSTSLGLSTPSAGSSTGSGLSTPSAGSTPSANTSGSVITNIVMARSTKGSNFDPVDPTTSFAPADTFHAVVTIEQAPNKTAIRAVWIADDVGSAAAPNTKIDEYTLTTSGSRNLDFTLKPKTSWPTGTFHVDVYVNDTLAQTVNFSVASDSGATTSSGLIDSTTFCRSVTPQVFDPVDPTSTFTPKDITLHLVVAIKDAPDNTSFKASWYFGSQLIDSTTLQAGGTRNLDFTLKQTKPWPTGDYHVDVSVNDTLDQTATFQVQ